MISLNWLLIFFLEKSCNHFEAFLRVPFMRRRTWTLKLYMFLMIIAFSCLSLKKKPWNPFVFDVFFVAVFTLYSVKWILSSCRFTLSSRNQFQRAINSNAQSIPKEFQYSSVHDNVGYSFVMWLISGNRKAAFLFTWEWLWLFSAFIRHLLNFSNTFLLGLSKI